MMMKLIGICELFFVIATTIVCTCTVESFLVNNAKECSPVRSDGGGGSTTTRSSSNIDDNGCEEGYHCVFNGHSSLHGYCIDDEHKSTHMDMPEGLQPICFICGTPGTNDGNERIVTVPDGKVGAFTCDQLDQMGIKGMIPKTNCDMFRRMIHDNNNLCGCKEADASVVEYDNGDAGNDDDNYEISSSLSSLSSSSEDYPVQQSNQYNYHSVDEEENAVDDFYDDSNEFHHVDPYSPLTITNTRDNDNDNDNEKDDGESDTQTFNAMMINMNMSGSSNIMMTTTTLRKTAVVATIVAMGLSMLLFL